MDKEQSIKYLQKYCIPQAGDYGRENGETRHQEADWILCRFLEHLGHHDLVVEYEKVVKHFSKLVGKDWDKSK